MFRCVCFAGGQIKSTPSIAWRTLCFNPRPPCGGRPQVNFKAGGGLSFQSTSSVWRTTVPGKCPGAAGTDFNPRPPCGRRQVPAGSQHPQPPFQSASSVWRTTVTNRFWPLAGRISIHVLRVEDDRGRLHMAAGGGISIHVLRVKDDCRLSAPRPAPQISIHVLRVEDDS